MKYNIKDFTPVERTNTFRGKQITPYRIALSLNGTVSWFFCNYEAFRKDMETFLGRRYEALSVNPLYNSENNLLMLKFKEGSIEKKEYLRHYDNSTVYSIRNIVTSNIRFPEIIELEPYERIDGWYIFGEFDGENSAIVYDLNEAIPRINEVKNAQ